MQALCPALPLPPWERAELRAPGTPCLLRAALQGRLWAVLLAGIRRPGRSDHRMAATGGLDPVPSPCTRLAALHGQEFPPCHGFPGRRHCLSIGRRPGGLRQTWRLEITQVYRYGSLVRSLTQHHWQHGGASGASLVQVAGRTSLLTFCSVAYRFWPGLLCPGPSSTL